MREYHGSRYPISTENGIDSSKGIGWIPTISAERDLTVWFASQSAMLTRSTESIVPIVGKTERTVQRRVRNRHQDRHRSGLLRLREHRTLEAFSRGSVDLYTMPPVTTGLSQR